LLNIIFFPFILSSHGQIRNNFTLEGDILGITDGVIYLISYDSMNRRVIDSSEVENGKFQFRGMVKEFSNLYYLKLDKNQLSNGDSINAVQIPIAKGKMKISLKVGSFSKFYISENIYCEEFLYYERNKMKILEKIYKLEEKIEEEDNPSLKKVTNKELFTLKQKFKYTQIKYSLENPNSILSPYIIFWLSNEISRKEYPKYFDYYKNLSKKQQNSFYGDKIKAEILEMKASLAGIGELAPIFYAIDSNGDSISLSEINKDKYLLIDFWASWCVPCRAENKDLRQLYKQYKSKGFEILSISDDSDLEQWKNAIKNDSVQIWKHALLSNTTIRNTETINGEVNEYFFKILPTKFLVDKEGIIIERFEGGGETKRLINCLEKLLNN
jgi:peroxiredoxin